MKRAIAIFFIIMACSVSYSQEEVETDSCGPYFKDFFDFSVGDVFQYKKIVGDCSMGEGCDKHITILKYEILTKDYHGDSIIYAISGITNSYKPTPNNPYSDRINLYSNRYTDSLVYVDSMEHFLNQCDGDLVRMPLDEDVTEDSYYSHVSVSNEGSIITKSIGGWENLYFISEDSTLLDVGVDPNIEEVYGQKLGLMRLNYTFFEQYYVKELEGYIIGGIKVGVITPDSQLLVGIKDIKSKNSIYVYPTPSKDKIFISNGISSFGDLSIKIYSLQGDLLVSEIFEGESFNIQYLNPGIYLYQIFQKEKSITSGKLFKE